MRRILSAIILICVCGCPASGQEDTRPVSQQIAELNALVLKLQARVADLEQKLSPPAAAVSAAASPAAAVPVPVPAPAAEAPKSDAGLLHGTTVNFYLDGYYGYNFNDPIGRVNLLRAYDVTSNAFTLNQTGVVLENAPDPDHGKRFGLRLDLQFGAATATLQGNPANEPRPEIYRNIYQAYGTYVFPVGKGLTVDFGKWASSLGIEGNYVKDQMNYSRSFTYDFLPFYHMGARVNYRLSDTVAVNYWITNGTQQTEPFNGFKDQLGGVVLQPRKNLSWTVNYYFGQEHPDFAYVTGSVAAGTPAQQGMPFELVADPAKGKLHIFDTYATWNATPRLTFAGEADYAIERYLTTSAPAHADIAAGYVRYQISPRVAAAARSEYFSDRGGLFSGVTQALKEQTVTFEQRITEGLLLREEWRRDASNQAYFFTNVLGRLKKEQNTATLGMVWWFGGKEGAW